MPFGIGKLFLKSLPHRAPMWTAAAIEPAELKFLQRGFDTHNVSYNAGSAITEHAPLFSDAGFFQAVEFDRVKRQTPRGVTLKRISNALRLCGLNTEKPRQFDVDSVWFWCIDAESDAKRFICTLRGGDRNAGYLLLTFIAVFDASANSEEVQELNRSSTFLRFYQAECGPLYVVYDVLLADLPEAAVRHATKVWIAAVAPNFERARRSMPNPYEKPHTRPESDWKTCPTCGGNGTAEGKTCWMCHGSGRIRAN